MCVHSGRCACERDLAARTNVTLRVRVALVGVCSCACLEASLKSIRQHLVTGLSVMHNRCDESTVTAKGSQSNYNNSQSAPKAHNEM